MEKPLSYHLRRHAYWMSYYELCLRKRGVFVGLAAWCASTYIMRLISRILERKSKLDRSIVEEMKSCSASCSEEEKQANDEHAEMQAVLRRGKIEVFVMNALSGQCLMKGLAHPMMLAGDIISKLNSQQYRTSCLMRVVVHPPIDTEEMSERHEYILANEQDGHVHLWRLWDKKAKNVTIQVCKVPFDRERPWGGREMRYRP